MEGAGIQSLIFGPLLIGAVEVTQIPGFDVEHENNSAVSKFNGVLRGMTVNKIPFGLRIERIRNKTRIFYTIHARKQQDLAYRLGILEQMLKANLPRFRFKIHSRLDVPDVGLVSNKASVFMTGDPLSIDSPSQRKDALVSVSETIQSLDNVVFQIFIEPRESKKSDLKKVESEYQRALENSETTITSPQSGILSEPEQKSRRKVDAREARKAEQLQKRIDRLRNRFLCDVRVTSVSWAHNNSIAKEQALRPINILRGVLVPSDEEQDFTVQVKRGKKDCEQLLAGHPTGKKTTLSVSETMAYFVLPDSDLGIQVSRNAEFPSNPLKLKTADETPQNKESSDSIDIGYILDDRDNPVERLRLPKDSLATSMGIFGDIGSGKTTTVLTALYELYEKGIPFLVLCPSKNEEYRHFIRLKPTTRIFTPADETTAPLRFNPHRFSKGVLVNSVISSVKAAYIAALPNIGMVISQELP
jgi:hypothetical protein